MRYNKALKHVGDQNKYQKMLVIGSFLIWLLIGFTLGTLTYIYGAPSFTCQGVPGPQNQQYACSRLNECQFNEIDTLTYKAGLYCQKTYLRDTIAAMNAVGCFTGLLTMGFIGDRYGRFLSMTISLIMIIMSSIVNVVGGTYNIIPLLMVGQILSGFGVESAQVTLYIFVIQSASKNFANKNIVIMNAVWAFALMLLCPILYMVPNWKKFTIWFQLGYGCLVLVAYLFVFKQTPQYALTKSSQKCLKQLNKIAEINQQSVLPQDTEILPDNTLQSLETPKKLNYWDMFSSWVIVKRMLCLIVILVVMNGQYSGIAFSFSLIGFGFKINTLICGGCECLGYIIAVLVVHKLPRKKSLYASLSITIFLMASFQFLNITEQNQQKMKLVQLVILGITRSLYSFSYAMWALILTQSFSKDAYKGLAVGLVSSFGGLGILSTYLITFAQKLNFKPLVFIAMISPICIIFICFLQQTNPGPTKEQTPNSIVQEEEFDDQGYPPDRQLIN